MKKQFLSAELSALMLCAAVPLLPPAETAVCAYYEEDDSLEYSKQFYSDEISIIRCPKNAVDIVIPAEIDGMPVTEISGEAFAECKLLRSVVIPDSVRDIGQYAFSMCSQLRSVTFSKGLTGISSYAFYHCDALESLDLPDSLTSISDHAFAYCSSLKSIVLPECMEKLYDEAFYRCTGLTEVTIPKSLTGFGLRTFAGTPWIKEQRKENPIVVVNNAIIDVHDAKGEITIPEGVTSLGRVFTQNQDITTVTLPQSISELEVDAFNGCTSLTSVTLSEGLTRIGPRAFSGCKALREINIPDSLSMIDGNPFEGTPWFADRLADNPVVAVNNTIIDAGNAAGETIVPEGVTKLDGWFRENKAITSILLPSTLTKVYFNSFDSCTALTSVTLAEGIECIGEWAFSDCPQLTSVTVPKSVKQIEASAFFGSDNVTIRGYAGSYAETFAKENEIPFEAITEQTAGDMNGDGAVNLKDVVLLRRYIAGGWGSDPDRQTADFNGDGAVNLKDVTLLRRSIAGGWNAKS